MFLFLTKIYWVIRNQGLIELARRSCRYLKKHHLKGLLFYYTGRNFNYNMWLNRETKKVKGLLTHRQEKLAELSCHPVISIIMPVWNTDLMYLKQAIESVLKQIYPYWEICIANDGSDKQDLKELLENMRKKDERIKVVHLPDHTGIVGVTNAALSLANGEFVGFLNHNDKLAIHALLQIANLINKNPEVDVIYTDEDCLIENNKRCNPLFKPDWSPDLLLSMNYIGHFLVVRRRLVRELEGLRPGTDGSQDYDLVLRVTEKTKRIAHIPEILYHRRIASSSVSKGTKKNTYEQDKEKEVISAALLRRRLKGRVTQISEGRYRIIYQVQGNPLVSIIIPTKDKAILLEKCINSIREKSSYKNYELVIVDNESKDKATLEYFAQIIQIPICKVIPFNKRFNYAEINNFTVSQAKGEYIVFLNNDIEVISSNWLEEMLGYAQQSRVGTVGAKLLFPNKTVQHGGVILGLRKVVGHAFYGLPASNPGYMGLATVTRNCSAVTAACMMLRRSVFEEAGGFDEKLDVAYNDVDFCLRIIQKGHYIVWTPHAVLYHHESATRGQYWPERNIKYFCEKWKDILEHGDPFYNINLTLDRSDFMLKV